MRAGLAAIALLLGAALAAADIDWQPYVTLAPEDGTAFVADSARVLPALASTGVPGINFANDGRVILGFSGWPGGRGAATSADGGRTFTPLTGIARPQQVDGGFIYLPDGRTRFVTEERRPTTTQPPPEPDRELARPTITGHAGRDPPPAPATTDRERPRGAQIGEATWRMRVGDWYRTGIRTALTTDWGGPDRRVRAASCVKGVDPPGSSRTARCGCITNAPRRRPGRLHRGDRLAFGGDDRPSCPTAPRTPT
jgi:hypothetical protein